MLKRFRRIEDEFGMMYFVRTLLLLIGLLGMVILGFYFSSYLPIIIAGVGLLLGFLLRNKIPDGAEYYPRIISVGLFIYGIVLFFGDRFGIENYLKLTIITATTVVIFNLQFWTLSNESIVNQENSETN